MSWPSDAGSVNGLVMQNASPAAGATVQMTSDNTNGVLNLTPAATLATLTVSLPSDASSIFLQTRRIFSSKAIGVLTINGATTIYNNVTAMNAGDCVAFMKIASNTWTRLI